METSHKALAVASFGLLVGASLLYAHKSCQTCAAQKQPKNLHITSNKDLGDDSCLSLYYSKDIASDGKGFPIAKTIDQETIKALTAIKPEYKRIPLDMYKSAVENMIIVCVDIICQRKSDKKFLLFYRRDAPAANIWWWPGGRMFRGETFFDTAIRKIRDETGNPSAVVVPKGVVSVWNTFFPDSNWDKDRREGYEGTQTVNITIACELMDDAGDGIRFDEKAGSAWAVEAHRWVSVSDGLIVGNYDKYVRLNLEKATDLGLLYK